MTGRTISHYRILSKLGEGGMGVVYKAEDTKLNRIVALKFLPPHLVESQRKQRFLQEARNAARLQHPNICPVYEVDESDGQLFFAMACLEGQTVAERIEAGPLSIDEALETAIQIACGLGEAHRQRIVHRDIKSSNIMVNAQRHAYILDFGLAISESTTRLTVDGGRVGTPAYMSPEQAQGREVDARTDIWSLGVVLFEMLAGGLPFRGSNAVAVVHAILHQPLPPIQELRPDVSGTLKVVLEKALAKDANARWQTVRDFERELRLLRGGSALESRTVTLVGSGALAGVPKPRSRRALFAGVCTLPVVGAAAYYGWSKRFALPAQKRIAVLPFQVIGQDEGLRATVDGLVEVVTARLSDTQFSQQTLIVPASEIRAKNITSANLANSLYGANLVIAGTAQKLSKMVQFTVTMLNPVSMVQLGARSFDVDSADPVALRDAALNGVLNLLQLHLAPTDASHSGESASPQAYADYLQGTGYLARYDRPGNIDLALASFQSAVRNDPKYALAYSGLARAYKLKVDTKGEKQWSDLALQFARQATQLAPQLAKTHAQLGDVYGYFGHEEEAILEFQRALQISPGDGEVYRDLAEILENRGRFGEAEAMYQESVRKRPNDWYGHLLIGLFLERRNRYRQAEDEFRSAIRLTPNNPIALRNLGGLYRIEGRYQEAAAELQKAIKLTPSPSLYSALGVVFYYQHRFPEAAAAVEKALDEDSARYFFWGNLGMIYKEMPGKEGDAEHALRRAVTLGSALSSAAPTEYNAHANLAEYYARLGLTDRTNEQLHAIPEAVRDRFLVRFALAYFLTGQKDEAIKCLLGVPEPTQLYAVKDDPSLGRLWADPDLKKALRAKWGKLKVLG